MKGTIMKLCNLLKHTQYPCAHCFRKINLHLVQIDVALAQKGVQDLPYCGYYSNWEMIWIYYDNRRRMIIISQDKNEGNYQFISLKKLCIC